MAHLVQEEVEDHLQVVVVDLLQEEEEVVVPQKVEEEGVVLQMVVVGVQKVVGVPLKVLVDQGLEEGVALLKEVLVVEDLMMEEEVLLPVFGQEQDLFLKVDWMKALLSNPEILPYCL